MVVGNVVNDGTITVQNGVLTVTGGMAGTGSIIGGFGGRDGGHGLEIRGDFVPAVNSTSLFDMTGAVLRLAGDPARGEQELEVLAADRGIGRVTIPDPSLYSIGELHVVAGETKFGPAGAMVRLVDRHRNSPHARGFGREALYVNRLRLDPGVTLDVAGLHLYYGEIEPEDALDGVGGITITDSIGGGGVVPLH